VAKRGGYRQEWRGKGGEEGGGQEDMGWGWGERAGGRGKEGIGVGGIYRGKQGEEEVKKGESGKTTIQARQRVEEEKEGLEGGRGSKRRVEVIKKGWRGERNKGEA